MLCKLIRLCILLPLTCLVFVLPALAESYGQQYETSGADSLSDALPEETAEQIERLGINPADPSSLSDFGINAMLGAVFDMITGRAKSPLVSAAAMLGAILLCALCTALGGNEPSQLNEVFSYICLTFVGLSVVLPMAVTAVEAMGAISLCSGFMLTFIPVYAGILLAMGRPGSALGLETVLFGLCQTLMQVCSTVIAPLVGMYTALSISGALAPNLNLGGFTAGIKKASSHLLGVLLCVFVGVMGLQTAIGAATDSIANRTARFAVGTFVPVVGASLAEILGTLQSSIGLLKSSVGIYAVVAVIMLLLPALVELMMWQLVIFAGTTLSDMFSLKGVSDMLRAIGGALSIVIGIIAVTAALFIISLTVVSIASGG